MRLRAFCLYLAAKDGVRQGVEYMVVKLLNDPLPYILDASMEICPALDVEVQYTSTATSAGNEGAEQPIAGIEIQILPGGNIKDTVLISISSKTTLEDLPRIMAVGLANAICIQEGRKLEDAKVIASHICQLAKNKHRNLLVI